MEIMCHLEQLTFVCTTVHVTSYVHTCFVVSTFLYVQLNVRHREVLF